MLPENVAREYEALSRSEDYKDRVVGTLDLSNDTGRIVLHADVYWFGPMLFVGTEDEGVRVRQICPTHAEQYQAKLGKPTKGICSFCQSGSSYGIVGRK